jgi:uncharacterized membrane protein YecN with MAPEG domain
MILPVTILYGTLGILVTLALALNISLYRMCNRVFAADPVPDQLHRRVRAHGNSAEWLAATTLALAFLELQHAPSLWLHLLGGGMLAARIFHSAFMLMRSRHTVSSATAIYTIAFATAGWALWLRLGG